jgi:vacuolar protein sorting-associated protein 35
MLGELRTSLLAPKTYFELHLRVTSELDGLARYFDARAKRGAAAEREARRAGRPSSVQCNGAGDVAVNAGPPAPTSLAALYDLVQHAGNVLPRLYLLVAVGAARARASKEREEAKKKKKRNGSPSPAVAAAAAAADNDDE